ATPMRIAVYEAPHRVDKATSSMISIGRRVVSAAIAAAPSWVREGCRSSRPAQNASVSAEALPADGRAAMPYLCALGNLATGRTIAAVAALIGDTARANMLLALMGGQALTAGELAEHAGVTAQTTSGHLAKLADAELIAMERQGRHRYFRLA